MPVMSNVVLADATPVTPVNRTFVPVGYDKNGVFWLEEYSSTAPAIGNWKISIETKNPKPAANGQNSSGRVRRVKIGMHMPVLETLGTSTISGIPAAPTVAYINRSFAEYVMPERSTFLDRDHLTKMSYNLLANANVLLITKTGEDPR